MGQPYRKGETNFFKHMERCITQMNTMVNSPFSTGPRSSPMGCCVGKYVGSALVPMAAGGTVRRPLEHSEVLGGGQTCTPLFQFTFPVTNERDV